MIHVLEARLRGARRWLSRNEWSLRFLNLKKLPEAGSERGLVLIQIDGLSRGQFEKALKRGRMPFLRKLMRREGYHLHDVYSGIPSTTAASQGEIFYGAKCCVPAFVYLDRKEGAPMRLLSSESALKMEKRLEKAGRGLCEGGSSYSNIFSGGAKESHWCASELNAAAMLRAANPLGFLVVALWNLPSVLKLIGLLAVEFWLALYDGVRGAIRLGEVRHELLFVFSRVLACVGLRELITVMSTMDVARGLPVVHVNYIGYDEQSHRRGPSSQFAHFSLRGIDASIKRLWTAAHMSSRRDYDIWIYSDHGQEFTLPYTKEQGRTLEDALAEALGEAVTGRDGRTHEAIRSEHYAGNRMEEALLRRAGVSGSGKAESGKAGAVDQGREERRGDKSATPGPEGRKPAYAVAAGPLGHVYLSDRPDRERLHVLARRLVEKAAIPLVMVSDGPGRALAFTPDGVRELPAEAAAVLGPRHAFADECGRDLVTLCHHPDAGDLVICGWRPTGRPLSFVIENGGHGGCGAEETHAFGLFPGNAPLPHHRGYYRHAEIRESALRLRGGASRPGEALAWQRRARVAERTLRVMTYNIHGCGGMDGKTSTSRIARVIAHYEPDVVALQECYGARKGDQMRAIAAELKAEFHFPDDLHMEQDDYGNALLSVHPMRVVKQAPLPTLLGGKPIEIRGAQWVALDLGGGEVNVVNCHLGLFSLERQRQAQALMGEEWLGRVQGPLVLLGDFNAFPSSSCYRILTERLYESQDSVEGHKPRNTFWGRLPVSRIDHIFCSGELKTLGVEIPRTHLTRLASDHLPLIAELGIEVAVLEPA
jgi:endonuclease/exonuclease/phosphatase family metal-dependent hydrolase